MPAKFSQHVRSFTSSRFVNSLRVKKPDAWVSGVATATGKVVYYGNAKFVASSSGTTGDLPPTHTSGVKSDGGVYWVFVEAMPLNDSFQGNLFMFIGKKTEWTDENTPPNPVTTDAQDYVSLADIVSLKSITSNDIKLGVTRNDWTSGSYYSQYDSDKDPFDPQAYDHPFFVVTDEYNVYKCLNNNNGAASTSKPTGFSTAILNLDDGYSWKYMGTISSQDAAGFLTSDFIPVEFKSYDDGSDQWDVQQSAQFKSISTFRILGQTGSFTTPVVSISGAGSSATAFATKTPANGIRQVLITNPGTGYESETYALVRESGAAGSGAVVNVATIDPVTKAILTFSIADGGTGYTGGAIAIITGDGTGATATVTIGGDGSVQQVNIVNGGSGYTTAKVWIIPGTKGAVAKAVLAPINGHGSNIVSELCASTAIISAVLSSTNAHLPVGLTSDFRQIGIITDVEDASGYAYAPYYIGPAHEEFSNGSSTLNKIVAGSGYILYLSNIKSVTRSEGQEEHIKVAVVF